MFSILIENRYKGTLLYADYGFDVSFFDICAVHKFLGKISSRNLLFSIITEIFEIDVIPSIWGKQDGTKFAHNILNKKFLKNYCFRL